MHELAEQPSTLYEFPKSIHPDLLPFQPVPSTSLPFKLFHKQETIFHWVIADLGHGAYLRLLVREIR